VQNPQDPFEGLTDGDAAHHEAVSQLLLEPLVHNERGVRLIRFVLDHAPQPLDHTGSNDFSSLMCIARVVRQIRAAVALSMSGYYSEVGTILRSAYEAASLGRFLAKEPKRADEWLRKQVWIPDRRVQRWLDDFLGEGSGDDFAAYYRELSAEAHPTARACVALVKSDGNDYELVVSTTFEEDILRNCLERVAAFTLWAGFAVERAGASEEVFPPWWRQELNDLAESVVPHGDWSHRSRDWALEEAKWEALGRRVLDANQLDEELESHPSSWTNVKPE
jgi:hypothetical protein